MNPTAVERERRIFGLFAEASSLKIDPESIYSPAPPAPDVLCTANGELLAFELVELIDQEYARRIDLLARTQVLLRDLPSKLEPGVRQALSEVGDPYIAFDFAPGLRPPDREQAAFEALKWLTQQEHIEGHHELPSPLAAQIESIHVHHWKWGLRLDSSGASYVSDPTLERLEKKFSKKYEINRPIELLMYTEIDLLLPEDVWRATVEPYVAEHLDASPFRRVWLFKAGTSSVEFVYPPL
jgi:hypothetical protein